VAGGTYIAPQLNVYTASAIQGAVACGAGRLRHHTVAVHAKVRSFVGSALTQYTLELASDSRGRDTVATVYQYICFPTTNGTCSQVQHGCQSSGQCDEMRFCIPEKFYCVGRDGELPSSWGVHCDESNNPESYNKSNWSKTWAVQQDTK